MGFRQGKEEGGGWFVERGEGGGGDGGGGCERWVEQSDARGPVYGCVSTCAYRGLRDNDRSYTAGACR